MIIIVNNSLGTGADCDSTIFNSAQAKKGPGPQGALINSSVFDKHNFFEEI